MNNFPKNAHSVHSIASVQMRTKSDKKPYNLAIFSLVLKKRKNKKLAGVLVKFKTHLK